MARNRIDELLGIHDDEEEERPVRNTAARYREEEEECECECEEESHCTVCDQMTEVIDGAADSMNDLFDGVCDQMDDMLRW